MDTIQAIQYLKENYEDIDPSYEYAAQTAKLLTESPGVILEYVMAPEDEDAGEEYGTEEWQKFVEDENDPAMAAKLIIEWILSRLQGQQKVRAMKEYLASPPDQRQYEGR